MATFTTPNVVIWFPTGTLGEGGGGASLNVSSKIVVLSL